MYQRSETIGSKAFIFPFFFYSNKINLMKNGFMKMNLIVEAKNLEKTYMQGKVPVHALRGLNFHLREGEFVAVVGPSGSGKSTLLNMLGALDQPTKGKIVIDGKDISKLNQKQLARLRQKIGFVFQFFNLIPRLSAYKNVELAMSIQKLSKDKRKRKAEEYLHMVGLGDRMNHAPNELSGGEQQRVAIARALAQDPRFLLMDEPSGNLDTKTKDIIMNLIMKLNKTYGVTIIIITHDMEIARKAKRIVHLVDGEIDNNQEDTLSLQKDTEKMKFISRPNIELEGLSE